MVSRPVLRLREINPLLFNYVEELVEIRVRLGAWLGSGWISLPVGGVLLSLRYLVGQQC
jgi:hypothetical protein